MTAPLKLSLTKPDYDAIVLQTQLYLSKTGTWNNILTSGTGQTLVEIIAANVAMLQFGIESAAREAYLDNAVRDSSIYAIARMLGCYITRKQPAQVQVVLRSSSQGSTQPVQLIPALSQFTINGTKFFNREPIRLVATGSVDANGNTIYASPIVDQATNPIAVLYEGEIRVQTIQANSQAFRDIYLNEQGFIVSNDDIWVTLVNPATNQSASWKPIPDGIWNAGPTDAVFYQSTSGYGDAVLSFGDGYNGVLPSLGYNIIIKYAVTQGALGNNGASGIQVSYISSTNVTGTTLTTISNGADQKSSLYYKSIAPNMFRAKGRAVSPQDYKAIALEYPNVASVQVLTQRDIDPTDLRLMDVVKLIVLPSSSNVFTDTDRQAFLTYFDQKDYAASHLVVEDAVPLYVDMYITLALLPNALSSDVVTNVTTSISALFEKQPSTLGGRIARSDIVSACMSNAWVDYIDIADVKQGTTSTNGVSIADDVDLVCDINQWFTLNATNYGTGKGIVLTTKYSERTFYRPSELQTGSF